MAGVKKNDDMLTFHVNLELLCDHFKDGIVGERYKELLASKKTLEYFNKTLLAWANKKRETITNTTLRKAFEGTTSAENLWFNINVNVMNTAFGQALNTWLMHSGSLDVLIVEALTNELIRTVVDNMINMLDQMFTTPSNLTKIGITNMERDEILDLPSAIESPLAIQSRNKKLN